MATYKLLFVDQEKEDVALMQELLPNDQFEIITLDNSHLEPELSVLTRNIPDAILLNAGLAVDNTCRLIRKIRSHHSLRHLLIIVLSVFDPSFISRDDLLAEADDVIQKPYSYRELTWLVDRIKKGLAFRDAR
ncbi:response regulator [Chitinophaga silvisoli]|uniref:Response regulator n=1 Tax=Chitinophaga silvisoli TaxID=2291814 RepID=A0A3E1NUB9_9BACT|nr:response regulator [Chitinophaga silvisoli]RFM31539.1 response regulator [Chitinophaga silvisoli]